MTIADIHVAAWIQEITVTIMDGRSPSIDYLCLVVPPHVGQTAQGDGHRTAALTFGEKSRNDYKAGQREIISVLLGILREQGFVGGDDGALRWLKPLNGRWQVNFRNASYAIEGQAERRSGKERSSLGERTHEHDNLELIDYGLLRQGKHVPLELEVLSPRGKSHLKKFQIHPLAMVIPPMTKQERDDLRDDIAKVGVRNPIDIYEGKILDGINRAYFASALKKPVHMREFQGTASEARDFVVSQNVKRRHLTDAQIDLIVYKIFGADAKKRAAAGANVGQLGARMTAPSAAIERGAWYDRAAVDAEKTGMLTTPFRQRSIAEVINAPMTLAAVERGEIKTSKEAERAARAEKSPLILTPINAGPKLDSTALQFSRMRAEADRLLSEIDHPNKPLGDNLVMEWRLLELRMESIRSILRERKVIS